MIETPDTPADFPEQGTLDPVSDELLVTMVLEKRGTGASRKAFQRIVRERDALRGVIVETHRDLNGVIDLSEQGYNASIQSVRAGHAFAERLAQIYGVPVEEIDP